VGVGVEVEMKEYTFREIVALQPGKVTMRRIWVDEVSFFVRNPELE
jgi:hypothetical protein